MATEKPRQKRGRPTEPAGQGAFKTAASTQVLVPGRSPSLPPPGSSALCFSWCFVCLLRLRSFPGTPPRVVTSGPGPCMFACRPPSSLSLSSLLVCWLLPREVRHQPKNKQHNLNKTSKRNLNNTSNHTQQTNNTTQQPTRTSKRNVHKTSNHTKQSPA